MRTYLLLRNNKQTGPHSLEEMLSMGLRAHDLVWVEGKSGAWRYPSELEEFRSHAPVLPDQSSELPFSEIQNSVLLRIADSQMPEAEDNSDELTEFPTLALFMKDQAEPRIESLPKLEAGDLPGREALQDAGRLSSPEEDKIESAEAPAPSQSKILVTLPAARVDNTLVVIQRRDQLPESPDIPAETLLLPDNITPPLLPPAHPQVDEPDLVDAKLPAETGDLETIVEPKENSFEVILQEPVAEAEQQKTEWLPKFAVAAAILSILGVAALILYSIFGPDPYQVSRPAPAKSQFLVKAEARSQITKLVSINMGEYKPIEGGKLSGFELGLSNGTAYTLDQVDVELQYLMNNGELYKTEYFSFKQIAPGAQQTIQVSESDGGAIVKPAIVKVELKELDLQFRP